MGMRKNHLITPLGLPFFIVPDAIEPLVDSNLVCSPSPWVLEKLLKYVNTRDSLKIFCDSTP